MPAQKRPLDATTPPPSPQPPLEEENANDSVQESENQSQKQTDSGSDSDESSDSSGGEEDEFIVVKLTEIRKEVQCPICLGIIRKTRTVMECLHRFCRECIDKSMRLGNNECPACRTHCASRRSLRDDPNYDALIAALYPNIDKYEEEELAFHEEEKARNKQIQASISQTFRRQAEALGKKRAATIIARRNLRGRRSQRAAETQLSDDYEGANENDGSKDSSSADERSSEVKSKRRRRRRGSWAAQQSSGTNGGADDNNNSSNSVVIRELRELIGTTEILGWGRGGMRSNTRHGGLSWAGGRLSKGDRISKIADHLKHSNENEELKVSLTLITFIGGEIPSLKRPYLCCSPRSSVRHLCQYVAMQTSMEASEIEILLVKDFPPVHDPLSLNDELCLLNPCQNELELLNEQLTLGEIHVNYAQQNLVLAYQQKAQEQGE